MQYLDVALAFAAFLGFCVFFNRRCGIAGGRTPLLSVSVILLWLTVWGIAGQLRAGGWLLYAAAAVLWVLSFVPPKKKTAAAPPLFDFGFVLFAALSAAAALLLAVRKPLFAEWDELSFWGTACKLVKLNNELYTTARVGWDWVGAQQPGAILVSYFFQFFGVFAPWKTFAAYDVLLFAAYAAVCSALAGDAERAADSWRRYPLGLAAALLCVLTPYLMTEYCRILEVTNTYMSAYGDIPAGVLAGGAAAWYFAARRGQPQPSPLAKRPSAGGAPPRGLWGIFPILAAAGLIKENAFPVALVAAGVAAADTLLCERGKKLWRRAAFAVGALAAPLAAYLLWNRHVAAVVSLRESAGEVGTTSLSTLQVVLLGFRQLLFPAERTARFLKASRDMLSAFVHTRMTLLGTFCAAVGQRLFGEDSLPARLPGTGLWVAATVILLFVLAAALCRDRQQRRRTVWAGVLSTLGFVGYYWVLILSYAFIFKPWQAEVLSDYNRYVSTYYLFWFLLAVTHLVCAARDDRPRHLLTGCALAAAGLSLLATAWMIRPQMTVLDYPETAFVQQKEYETRAQQLTRQVESAELSGPIFFVSTQDNGIRYFNYCYQLLPLQLDYSFGGGPLGSAENDDGSLYYHAISCGELAAYLEEHGCDYIFLESFDEIFADEYAPLFTDGLAAARQGTTLYVRTQEAETLQYAPWGGEAA